MTIKIELGELAKRYGLEPDPEVLKRAEKLSRDGKDVIVSVNSRRTTLTVLSKGQINPHLEYFHHDPGNPFN